MTYKKLFWIAIPISILLGGFITGKVITHRLMEAFSILQGTANIQGAKFRTTKLKEIRVLLDNSEIEKASELVDLLYKVDVDNLEFMQNEEMQLSAISETEAMQLSAFYLALIRAYEELLNYHESGAVEDWAWATVRSTVLATASSAGFADWWTARGAWFSDDFQKHVSTDFKFGERRDLAAELRGGGAL